MFNWFSSRKKKKRNEVYQYEKITNRSFWIYQVRDLRTGFVHLAVDLEDGDTQLLTIKYPNITSFYHNCPLPYPMSEFWNQHWNIFWEDNVWIGTLFHRVESDGQNKFRFYS